MRRNDQSSGYVMHSILYPVANEREALRRQGLKPKNHHQENLKVLRDLQRRNTENADRPATAPEPFKMARFKAVESHIKNILDTSQNEESTRPATARSFTRKGDGLAKMEARIEEAKKSRASIEEYREHLASKPPVPNRQACASVAKAASHLDVDFIKKNAIAAIKGGGAHTEREHPNAPERHESFGRVPGYILKRKEEKLKARQTDQARRVEHPDDCPPGMRLMKDEERKATLAELEKARLGLLQGLAGLPFIIDTPTLEARKANLEERLVQVDQAIALYSRKRLFVQA